MRTSRLRIILHWVPALIAIAVIIAESTATMSAENTSRWLLPLWIKLFGRVTPARWAVIHHYIRKTGHFVGYGLVSLAFLDGCRASLEKLPYSGRIRIRQAAILALACTLLLAIWDEWHQSFLPGRTSSVVDVGIDFCGGLTAHFVLIVFLSLRQLVHQIRT
jgi:VanZ family protein